MHWQKEQFGLARHNNKAPKCPLNINFSLHPQPAKDSDEIKSIKLRSKSKTSTKASMMKVETSGSKKEVILTPTFAQLQLEEFQRVPKNDQLTRDQGFHELLAQN